MKKLLVVLGLVITATGCVETPPKVPCDQDALCREVAKQNARNQAFAGNQARDIEVARQENLAATGRNPDGTRAADPVAEQLARAEAERKSECEASYPLRLEAFREDLKNFSAVKSQAAAMCRQLTPKCRWVTDGDAHCMESVTMNQEIFFEENCDEFPKHSVAQSPDNDRCNKWDPQYLRVEFKWHQADVDAFLKNGTHLPVGDSGY